MLYNHFYSQSSSPHHHYTFIHTEFCIFRPAPSFILRQGHIFRQGGLSLYCDSSFLRSSFEAPRFVGLVYVTSTDGYISGGHRPLHGRVRERQRSGGGRGLRRRQFRDQFGRKALIVLRTLIVPTNWPHN